MDALFCSYSNLGTKMPKNDATITRKKDDGTVNARWFNFTRLPHKMDQLVNCFEGVSKMYQRATEWNK